MGSNVNIEKKAVKSNVISLPSKSFNPWNNDIKTPAIVQQTDLTILSSRLNQSYVKYKHSINEDASYDSNPFDDILYEYNDSIDRISNKQCTTLCLLINNNNLSLLPK